MEALPKYRQGQPNPNGDGTLFWFRKPKTGKDYWVLPDEFKRRREARYAKRAVRRQREDVRQDEREYAKIWGKSEAGKESNKLYRSKNQVKANEWRKAWAKNNRPKVNAMCRTRMQDPGKRIEEYARTRVKAVLKGRIKHGRTKELLGCTRDQFMQHIEAQFESGMNWNNHATQGWHLDHILPLAMFDLTREDHQRIAFNFRNYRPAWWKDNLSKKDKLIPELVTKHELDEAVASLQ